MNRLLVAYDNVVVMVMVQLRSLKHSTRCMLHSKYTSIDLRACDLLCNNMYWLVALTNRGVALRPGAGSHRSGAEFRVLLSCE